jgi:hypothetical protein
MNFLQQAWAYIFTAGNWSGKAGLGARILEHLQYTGVARSWWSPRSMRCGRCRR